MKFNKWIIGLAALAAIVFTPAVRAQLGNDSFSSQTTLILSSPAILPAAAPILSTNGAVDLLGFTGRGTINLVCVTNAGGTVQATIQTSADTNTWSTLNNYAVITSPTAVTVTNLYYSTNATIANSYLLPYTATSPTAATAGFATPYPAYAAWTNASGTVTVSGAGIAKVGVNLTDSPRYMRVIWSCTGAATNGNTGVAAWLTGYRTPPIVK